MSDTANTPLDTLQNEIVREKFSALRRISENLESYLQELEIMNGRINEAMRQNFSTQHINEMIEEFNVTRKDAIEWRYYLTVTREASGLFHRSLGDDDYPIPPQKIHY